MCRTKTALPKRLETNEPMDRSFVSWRMRASLFSPEAALSRINYSTSITTTLSPNLIFYKGKIHLAYDHRILHDTVYPLHRNVAIGRNAVDGRR